jgi:hypothetical protein
MGIGEPPEERIAGLLAELPVVPPGWVEAAATLPAARRELDRLVARAEADAAFRAEALADLESAFRRVGVERPSGRQVEAARRRLSDR